MRFPRTEHLVQETGQALDLVKKEQSKVQELTKLFGDEALRADRLERAGRELLTALDRLWQGLPDEDAALLEAATKEFHAVLNPTDPNDPPQRDTPARRTRQYPKKETP